jgi:hypothetical protein
VVNSIDYMLSLKKNIRFIIRQRTNFESNSRIVTAIAKNNIWICLFEMSFLKIGPGYVSKSRNTDRTCFYKILKSLLFTNLFDKFCSVSKLTMHFLRKICVPVLANYSTVTESCLNISINFVKVNIKGNN